MTFTEELIANARDIWQKYYSHPFIRGMIDGSLDRDKFCLYLIQDSKYLVDYAKVYAHTFIKAKDVEVMRMIHEDMGLLHSEEDMMHIRYLAEAGYAVASVEYRQSNEGKFPAGLKDVQAAVRYLTQEAERFQLRMDKIGLMGRSAGGNLAT